MNELGLLMLMLVLVFPVVAVYRIATGDRDMPPWYRPFG